MSISGDKPAAVGRPSEFTTDVATEICARIMAGESLRAICSDGNMPGKSTVFRWLAQNGVFRDQYARARAVQMDTMAEEILDIADDGTNDWMERIGKDGAPDGWTLNGEHVQRSRVRVDTRKWLMSKLAPKKYGERVEIDAIVRKPEEALADEELQDLIANIKARAAAEFKASS